MKKNLTKEKLWCTILMMDTDKDANLIWKPQSSETLLETCVFDVEKVKYLSPENTQANFFLLDCRDWVIVVPLLRRSDGDFFVMVRQWRHGCNQISTEFPGGVIDEGESPEEAAKRELLEETGLVAKKLVYLGTNSPNPAIMKNRQHFFAATEFENPDDARKLSLDDTEFLTTFLESKKSVIEKMGEGEYIHGMMMCALHLFLKKVAN